MSRPARVLLGVVLGALIALCAHPYSRPRLFGSLLSWGRLPELDHAPELLSGIDRLPEPKSLADYSLWMEASAQRVLGRLPTTEREWENLAEAARRASTLDPSNAFWPQMQAVIALARRQPEKAERAWSTAARKSQWDDGQTARLLRLRNRIAAKRGEGAWISSAVAPLRTLFAARAIEAVARDVAKSTSLSTKEGLTRRYDTLLNGKLIRDGARSLSTAEVGIAMIELATYTSNLSSISSPRKLLLARVEFYEALRTKHSQTAAEIADRAFRDNDSWLGYPNSSEAAKDSRDLAILAALANGTGSVLLITSLVGVSLVGAARFFEGSFGGAWLVSPRVLILAVALAGFTLWDTRQTTLAVACAAAVGLLAFGPRTVRRRPSFALGPLHAMLCGMIAFLGLASVALGLATNLALGVATLGTIDLPAEVLGGRDPSASVAILAVSLLAALSSFYGWAHRLAPASVLTSTLRKVGVSLAWGGVVLAVVGSPALLVLDRNVALASRQRLENEPLVYYLEN